MTRRTRLSPPGSPAKSSKHPVPVEAHGRCASDIAQEPQQPVDVAHADDRALDPTPPVRRAADLLHDVAIRITPPPAGPTERILLRDITSSGGLEAHLHGEDAEVAELRRSVADLRRGRQGVPDLEPAAAGEAHQDAGVLLADDATGVARHHRCRPGVLDQQAIEPEARIPGGPTIEIADARADLLQSVDAEGGHVSGLA